MENSLIDMQPKVSVIVPVYNVEAYLEECLNSIVEQTFKDIEIIIINDGSKDRSIKIIQKFASKDKRVILCSQTNKGVSAARNTGIRQVKGEYILFVDSDDKIIENTIEVLYQNAITTNADLVIGNASNWYQDGSIKRVFDRRDINNISGLSGEICFQKLVQIHQMVFPPLVYLFFVKRELIIDHKLLFKRNIIHEDELWCVKTMLNSKRVSLIDFDYYLYRQREGSIMNSNNNTFRIESMFIVSKELKKFASELKKKDIPEYVIECIYIRIFIQYHVIDTLITNRDRHFLPNIRFYSRLLSEIYSSLNYSHQKYCLAMYSMATKSIINKIKN